MREQDGVVHLVLDDLHTVTSAELHEQLVELVAAAAPRLRLVAISRHDPPWPLHRMRLDGLLMDLRGDALAFGTDEAAALFGLLGLELSAEHVEHLVARTRGWAAGLRLAAIGALAAEDPVGFIHDLSGRSDYIADYLLREVYERQRPEWRDFLARVGVVDEVCPALAQALGCGSDSGHRLTDLVRQNAFIEQLRERPGWYRLHPLLLDFLRSRATDVAERRQLHRRAAEWFQTQAEPRTALHHALEGHAWDLAAGLVGTHIVTWTVRQPPGALVRQLADVPREEILTQAGLAIGLAAALAMLGEPDDVPTLVAAAEPLVGAVEPGPQLARYELLLDLIDVGRRRWSGDIEAVLAGCRRMPTEPAVLSNLGLSDWDALRTLLINNMGSCELWMGQFEAASVHLGEAAREDGNRPLVLPTLNAQAHLAYLHALDGELRQAEAMGRHALEGFAGLGIPTAVQARCAYLAMAAVAVDRADPIGARRWLAIARQTPPEPHTQFVAELLRACVLAAEGSLFEALAAVRRTRQRAAKAAFPLGLKGWAGQLEALLLAQAGNAAAARSAAAAVSGPVEQMTPGPTTVRARVATHLAAVDRRLAAGLEQAALDSLEQALAAAAPELLRQPFLAQSSTMRRVLSQRIELGTGDPGFAVDLLRRMNDAPGAAPAAAALLVPLTERELNVLRYLATTLSTREIADRLYVSVNTVKTHQRAIHQKLGARDRRTAVAHARELGLL